MSRNAIGNRLSKLDHLNAVTENYQLRKAGCTPPAIPYRWGHMPTGYDYLRAGINHAVYGNDGEN